MFLDNFVCTLIGAVLFLFFAIMTLCIDGRFRDMILELLNLF